MKYKAPGENWLIPALVYLFVAFWGASCTTSGPSPAVTKLGEQIAVQWAVMKVVENNPEYAARIIEISGIVRATVSKDQTATVQTIYELIVKQIDWTKLNKPSDRFLIDSLLTAMQVALNERVGTGTGMLPVDRAIAISEVVKWIEDGARSAVVP